MEAAKTSKLQGESLAEVRLAAMPGTEKGRVLGPSEATGKRAQDDYSPVAAIQA